MRAHLGRLCAAVAAMGAALCLCACDPQEERSQSGGGSLSAPAASVSAPAADQASKTAAAATQAVGLAAGSPEADPLRPLFDGSSPLAGTGPDSAAVAAQSDPQRRAQALALINAKPRYGGLSSGSVPAPGTLPKVALPKADPSAGTQGGGPVLAAFDSFVRKSFGLADRVFGRRAWGAAAARGSQTPMSPRRVTVHHTDGHPRTELSAAISEMRGYQSYHMNGHGWNDIGYHFVIDGAGRVFEGRHTDVLGAHAEGANQDNIGIALMGDYNRDPLKPAQRDILRHLITFLALKYQTDPRQKGFIQGHMHFNQTDCPGRNVVAFLDELRRGVSGETVALLQGDRPSGAAGSFTPLVVLNG
ncbi:MAG: peptidoglycan recognition family protein [Elusimicrobia bacterium]|nr:peptidoglycan recognition family protein [Elusimicrobiota bacterium]